MTTDYIEVGKIMGAHGLKGNLRIMTYNPDSSIFVQGGELYLETDGQYKAHEVLKVSSTGKGLLVRLAGIDDHEHARSMFGRPLFFPREELQEPGEHENFVVDLIGLKVIDAESGRNYGEITAVVETGANDCYVVSGEDLEILVPATREVVLDVDLESGAATVRLPEGLVEIYED